MRQAIRAANRANVAVYAIDPRGLGGSADDPSASVSVYTGAPVPTGATSIQSALQSELAFSQESLRGLAEETGGFAFLNRNDLTRGLDRVVEESSHYYLLGYRSTNPRQDGRYRKIGVRVRVRDLEVRARKGYFAPDEGVERRQPAEDLKGASPELARLIQGPLPVPGIPMRAIASVLRVGDDRAVVPLVVELDIAGFVFEESEGRLHDAVEFSALATDRRGRVQGSVHSEVQLAVRPETHQLLKRAGFRFLTSLELPSGQHRIRIAAIESRTKRGGSVFYDVEIPDYGQSALVMTPLVVTSASEALIPVIGEEEDKRKAILLPTTRRRFSQSDRLIVLAKVYPRHSPGSMLPVIEIVTEVEDMDQQVVFRRMQERGGTELIAPGDGITQEMEVSLSEWAPGEYQVQMTARSFARGAGDDVSRRALIEIY